MPLYGWFKGHPHNLHSRDLKTKSRFSLDEEEEVGGEEEGEEEEWDMDRTGTKHANEAHIHTVRT